MSEVDSILVPIFETNGPDYEVDFCAWSEEQSRRLRSLRIPGLDIENLAEEIESLSRSDKRQIRSRLAVLLPHLLEWRHQPDRSGQSWLQRSGNSVAAQYRHALTDAQNETGLWQGSFPPACEWTQEQVLSEAYLPDPAV